MKTMRILVSLAVLAFGCGRQQLPAETEIPLCNLSILDSVGVELGDSAYIFGGIMGIEFMPDGGFAVLDRATCNIRLFTEMGEHTATIGRRGTGPGEIVQPYGLLLWSNGDLGVIDPFQGGLLRFSPGGEYMGIVFEATHNIPFDPRMVGDTAYIARRTAIETEGDQTFMETYLGFFPMSHEPSLKYISDRVPLDPASMADYILHNFFYSSWAVDPASGTLYAAPFHEGEYRILAFPFEGGDPRVIGMEVEPVAKTPEEIELEKAFVASYLTAAEGGNPMYDVNCEPWPFKLPVEGMYVDDSGNLWVLRGDTGEVLFNVWNSSGERIFDVALPGFAAGDHSFRIQGDRMLLWRENPTDYQKIYIIAIPW